MFKKEHGGLFYRYGLQNRHAFSDKYPAMISGMHKKIICANFIHFLRNKTILHNYCAMCLLFTGKNYCKYTKYTKIDILETRKRREKQNTVNRLIISSKHKGDFAA